MKITVPSLHVQQQECIKMGYQAAEKQLKDNQNAPHFPPQSEIDESQYSSAHLLDKRRYEPPHPDIIGAYFRHFQLHFPEYKTDRDMAGLLGVSSDRRVREFKSGENKVPYEVWDRFLVITGRKAPTIPQVLGYMAG